MKFSEVLVVDECGDHVSDGFASPLWSHVANTLHSDELESAVVRLSVAGHLTVGEPRSPGVSDGPSELLDPALGTVGGDGTISVTRVEHKAGLALEDFINPHGGLVLNLVLKSLRAHLPSLNLSRDVESFTNVLSVHVVGEEVTVANVGRLTLEDMGGKRSVFSHGHTTLVGALLTVNDGGADTVFAEREVVVVTVKIVPVELAGVLKHLLGEGLTLGSLGSGADVMEVSVAVIVVP